MRELDTRDKFISLFTGRDDVWGHDEGRCIEGAPSWDAHLYGDTPMGIYPLLDDNTVRWGCIDIDFADEQLAWNLSRALEVLGITAWIEVSRSKGYHVWVFADDWVPAKIMREALMAACQIVDYSPKEVNPKQVDVAQLGRGYGNYVRLPYAMARTRGRQQMAGSFSVTEFVDSAWSQRASLGELVAAASLYVAPPPPTPIIRDVDATADRSQLNALGRHVLEHGPLETQDRSTALMVLAHQCRESNLTRGEALAVVAEGDARWGKFHNRPDRDQRLEEVIRRAYGG